MLPGAQRLRFQYLVLLAAFAPFSCSHCEAAKEELEYAILSDGSGEIFQAKELPVGMTMDSEDCILVHHTGCTSKARWRCLTCEAGDHVAADPFTSCHIKFEPLEGASLVRLTCQTVNHLTMGVSKLVDTGYYPRQFPTALRKCTWPHERVPPLRPDRVRLCNDTQERYEKLQRQRRLTETCSNDGCQKQCNGGTGGTAGSCGCIGGCSPSCGCACQDTGSNGATNCQCVKTEDNCGSPPPPQPPPPPPPSPACDLNSLHATTEGGVTTFTCSSGHCPTGQSCSLKIERDLLTCACT